MMNAKKYFKEKYNGIDYDNCASPFDGIDMVDFAEAYHQAKSKEEAEERYNYALYKRNEDGLNFLETVELAAFGKEEE